MPTPMPTGSSATTAATPTAANPLADLVVGANTPTQRPNQPVTSGAALGPGAGPEALGLPHVTDGQPFAVGAPLPNQLGQQGAPTGDPMHDALMQVLTGLDAFQALSPGVPELLHYAQNDDQQAATAANSQPSLLQALRDQMTGPGYASSMLPKGKALPYGRPTVPTAPNARPVEQLHATPPGVPGAALNLSAVNPAVWARMSQAQPAARGRYANAAPEASESHQAAQSAPTQTAAAPGS